MADSMTINRRTLIAIASLCISLTGLSSGCATTGQQADPPPRKTTTGKNKPKAGTPALATEPPVKAQPAAPPPTPRGPDADELAQFIQRAGDSSGPYTESDRKLIEPLTEGGKKPAPGSLQEAAVAIGIIRTAYNPLDAKASNFEESDLGGGNGITANTNKAAAVPATADAAASSSPLQRLETEAKAKGIDLPNTLATNPWLQTENIYQLVIASTQLAWNSPAAASAGTEAKLPPYAQELKDALTKRVSAWATFGRKNGLLVASSSPSGTEPGPQGTAPSQQPANGATPPPSTTPVVVPVGTPLAAGPQGDVREAEGLVAEAQATADKGDFDAAITLLGRVAPDSPQAAVAAEKLKAFSNKAVHSLRTKAAQAYTSAAPINDPDTRASYLERAKNYLQEALTRYPGADQLGTVRDNLAVITRDLAKISADRSASGTAGQGK